MYENCEELNDLPIWLTEQLVVVMLMRVVAHCIHEFRARCGGYEAETCFRGKVSLPHQPSPFFTT